MGILVIIVTMTLILAAVLDASPIEDSTVLHPSSDDRQQQPITNHLHDGNGNLDIESIQDLFTNKLRSTTRTGMIKRNRGMWVWMPEHGYVSVSNQVQPSGIESAEKPAAKTFRYGK